MRPALSLCALLLASVGSRPPLAVAAEKPNVVVILADDLALAGGMRHSGL